MKSILSNEHECYWCRVKFGIPNYSSLQMHHIYMGANRKVSDKNGFWVYLCLHHHTGSNDAVHHNRELDLKLKRECQAKFEESHTREEFLKLIGRNYL